MHQRPARYLLFSLVVLASLASAKEPAETQVDVLLRATASWNGTALPAYPGQAPEITVLRIKLPPGQALPEHKHPVINGGVLLAGELTIRTEHDETHVLRAGEALLEVVDTWHFGANEGTEPVDIVVFYVGTPAQAITVSRAQPQP